MDELRQRLWGVISERGCEATGLEYLEAARLVRKLKDEGISGLCLVSQTAAQHLTPVESAKSEKPTAKVSPAR
jgi:hypothetical protein